MTAAPSDFASRHRELLEQALVAIRKREYFCAYPESPSPKVYGEHAAADGRAAFEAWLGSPFPLATPG
ncbi:MAG: phenylacetic acid degradation protein PaaN, partial [Nocardioidaceae bacterium]